MAKSVEPVDDPDLDLIDGESSLSKNDLDMDQESAAVIIRITTVESLGAAIQAQRKSRKLTQAELAARTGVSRRFIYQLENGSRESFPLGKVLAVLRRLNLELSVNRRRAE